MWQSCKRRGGQIRRHGQGKYYALASLHSTTSTTGLSTMSVLVFMGTTHDPLDLAVRSRDLTDRCHIQRGVCRISTTQSVLSDNFVDETILSMGRVGLFSSNDSRDMWQFAALVAAAMIRDKNIFQGS